MQQLLKKPCKAVLFEPFPVSIAVSVLKFSKLASMPSHNNMTLKPAAAQASDVESAITTQVRSVLAKHNIPPHKQASHLSALIGVARSTVHRKFSSEIAWDDKELGLIAERFAVTVGFLRAQRLTVDAAIRIPRCPATGLLVVGPALDPEDTCELIAVLREGRWEVWPQALAPTTCGERYSVSSLSFSALAHTSVALLEDDVSAAAAMSDGLKEFGFRVSTFDNSAEFLAALPGGKFKGFVLDWNLSGTTAEAALAAIRSLEAGASGGASKQAPILVTTGVLSGIEQATVGLPLYKAAEKYDAQIMTKPAPVSLIAASMHRALAAR